MCISLNSVKYTRVPSPLRVAVAQGHVMSMTTTYGSAPQRHGRVAHAGRTERAPAVPAVGQKVPLRRRRNQSWAHLAMEYGTSRRTHSSLEDAQTADVWARQAGSAGPSLSLYTLART